MKMFPRNDAWDDKKEGENAQRREVGLWETCVRLLFDTALENFLLSRTRYQIFPILSQR